MSRQLGFISTAALGALKGEQEIVIKHGDIAIFLENVEEIILIS